MGRRQMIVNTEQRGGKRWFEVEAGWARKLTNRRHRHQTRALIHAERYDEIPSPPRTHGWVTW